VYSYLYYQNCRSSCTIISAQEDSALAAWLKQTDSMGTTRLVGCSVHREDRGPALFCSHSRYLIWLRNKSFMKFSDSARGEQNMDHKNNHDHSVQRLIIL
jgi:hypothetical protein